MGSTGGESGVSVDESQRSGRSSATAPLPNAAVSAVLAIIPFLGLALRIAVSQGTRVG